MSSLYLTRYTLKLTCSFRWSVPVLTISAPPTVGWQRKTRSTCHSRWLPPVTHPVVRRDQNHCRKSWNWKGVRYPVPKKNYGKHGKRGKHLFTLKAWRKIKKEIYIYIQYMLDGCSSLFCPFLQKKPTNCLASCLEWLDGQSSNHQREIAFTQQKMLGPKKNMYIIYIYILWNDAKDLSLKRVTCTTIPNLDQKKRIAKSENTLKLPRKTHLLVVETLRKSVLQTSSCRCLRL